MARAGAKVSGSWNVFSGERFLGSYPGIWAVPRASVPWLAADTSGNRVSAMNMQIEGPDLCSQVYDETNPSANGYSGKNVIDGYERCAR